MSEQVIEKYGINFEERAKQILSTEPILAAKDLEVQFTLRGEKLNAIRKCSLELYDGETLAIVGESGSGKSVFTKCFVGMLDKNGSITGGSILYNGQDLTKFTTEKEWRTIRGGKIAMVTQDPMTSLNPLKKIGVQIQEAIELHQGMRGREAKREAIHMLELVGIPDPERRYNQYPHEFSGGMRQRVVIAIAVACRPQILICDEPTTALDVTIQAQILDLIRKLQREQHMTIIYITHDLGVVANVADRVAVMYAGQIVEIGMVNEIFFDAWHPYTWALLGALPQLGVKGEKLPAIDGTPPNLFNKVVGDSFAPRNHQALNIDFLEEPPLFDVTPTHQAKTWMLDPRAPKINQPDTIRKLSSQHLMDAEPISHMDHPHLRPDREPLIEVKDLQITFGSGKKKFVAVDDVNFTIYRGETFSLVGESGSGKTTIGRSIIRLYDPTDGKITFNGREISGKLSADTRKMLRAEMQMIFQDPMASLNPRKKVEDIIGEGLDIHHTCHSKAERSALIAEMLKKVGLSPEHASRYPHQFSGGQRQRVGIARALIMQPKLIIADECISALDVSIQAQVVNLMKDIQQETGCAYLFIAHDLSMVKYISDRIGVLHLGYMVEAGTKEEIFSHPVHPYTKSLLSAIPHPNPEVEKRRKSITYDYASSGIDYAKGMQHLVGGTHTVLATDAELAQWTQAE